MPSGVFSQIVVFPPTITTFKQFDIIPVFKKKKIFNSMYFQWNRFEHEYYIVLFTFYVNILWQI